MKISARLWLAGMALSIALSGCGVKRNLFIPTEKDRRAIAERTARREEEKVDGQDPEPISPWPWQD